MSDTLALTHEIADATDTLDMCPAAAVQKVERPSNPRRGGGKFLFKQRREQNPQSPSISTLDSPLPSPSSSHPGPFPYRYSGIRLRAPARHPKPPGRVNPVRNPAGTVRKFFPVERTECHHNTTGALEIFSAEYVRTELTFGARADGSVGGVFWGGWDLMGTVRIVRTC